MLTPKVFRDFAKTSPSPMSPHWIDTAKKLLRQAADLIEAADEVIKERVKNVK